MKMENYKMSVVDVEVGMTDVYQATVEAVKPPRTVWKIVGISAFLVLCAVASVFFAWHFTSERQSKSELQIGVHSTATTEDHQKILTQIAKSTKAAIHLHLSGDQNEMSGMQWMNDVDQSFSTGDLKLENNRIIIPHDGLYFVYSQASFSVSCNQNKEDTVRKPLSYSVQWSSPSVHGPRKHSLLNGVKSACSAPTEKHVSDGHVYDFIYLGAVFQLFKGDKLSTETNHLAAVDEKSSKTFFGVFEL